MKKIVFLLVVLSLFSCNKDEAPTDFYNVAVPLLMNKSEFRSSVEIQTPRSIEEAGKIYAYNDHIFVNDEFNGIHVIDNTNPSSPHAISYIKVPGNIDISIKNNFLYADSSTDLVVFDISNIQKIKAIGRLEDVFSIYDYKIPEEADYADYSNFNFTDQIVVGWTIEKREINSIKNGGVQILETAMADSNSNIGKGGSLARFQIVEDYLYAVSSHEMTIFDISVLTQPTFVSREYSGNNLETMFEYDGFLYLGSTDGMYIYSLENPAHPKYVSELVHWTGCDPVVVNGNYAYLTIRGGNNCGDQESILEVIDVADKSAPALINSYKMDNPYGLGVKENTLFVCDGTSGLKVFDVSNPLDLKLLQTFSSLNAKDVIPLPNSLLMIGDNVLYQYVYVDGTINLISTYSL